MNKDREILVNLCKEYNVDQKCTIELLDKLIEHTDKLLNDKDFKNKIEEIIERYS